MVVPALRSFLAQYWLLGRIVRDHLVQVLSIYRHSQNHTEETRNLGRWDAVTWLADGIRSLVEFQLGPLLGTRQQSGGVRKSTLKPEFG